MKIEVKSDDYTGKRPGQDSGAVHKEASEGQRGFGDRAPRAGDDVSISKFSSLIERARSKALSLPDVRTDAVEKAREAIKQGKLPKATDIAAAIINHAANGQV